MNFGLLTLAEEVIRRCDREHPADAVLRQETRRLRGFSREEATDLSHMVFSYFRWRGWLDESASVSEQVRKAAGLEQRFMQDPSSFSDRELLERTMPSWILNEIELTPALARALQARPRLWLRARPGQGKAVAGDLGHCHIFGEGAHADVLRYDGLEDLFLTNTFHSGAFELQDLSSQAVGFVCSPAPGETWWDACAGEGGKLLHLSDLMLNQGLIWASDRSERRLATLKRRAGRAKVYNYRKALWNGEAKLPTRTKFDGILVDAPCTGTGTWQRNPHARWTLRDNDLKELAEVQLKLLQHASVALKPGGRLVYSVCSLTQSETVRLVERLATVADFLTPLPIKNPLIQDAAASPQLWLYPQQFGGNGMFIAAWTRRAG